MERQLSEKEKMILGELYDPEDKELSEERIRAHRLCAEYNATLESEADTRRDILESLLGKMGKDMFIQGPMQFDYGYNIFVGDRSYANFNLTILDTCPVHIGNDVFIGPNVSILTPLHPMKWKERNRYYREDGALADQEYGAPITIEDNCWIAGNVTICAGVTIGMGCVIGAGSVVTCDIPKGHFAAGNPCNVIRRIEE